MDSQTRAFILLAGAVLVAVCIAVWLSGALEPDGGDPSRPDKPNETNGRQPDKPDIDQPDVIDQPPRITPRTTSIRGIKGTVKDASGNPIPGATVYLMEGRPPRPAVALPKKEESRRTEVADLFEYYPDESGVLAPLGTERPSGDRDEKPMRETETDDNGAFEFKSTPPGRHRVMARSGDLSSAEKQAWTGRKVDLVVGEAAGLKGFVRSADDGRLLVGAEVRVVQGGQEFTTTAMEGGSFEFHGLPHGPVTLFASFEGYAGYLKKGILLVPGEVAEVAAELNKGYQLTVSVLGMDDESDDEPPIPGAIVGAVRQEDNSYVMGVADSSGRIVFSGLPKGTWLVNARAEAWLPAGQERVNLEGDMEWDLYLEKAIKSKLIVVDDRDVPVQGAEVWTANLDEEFESEQSKMVGVTNGSGEFEFAFDWDGKAASVFITKKGYGMATIQPDDPQEGETIKVKLKQGRGLRGQVTDKASGKGIPGAKIIIEVTPEEVDEEDLYATIYTDEKGKYSFPYLPTGEVWIEVEAEGYLDADADFETDTRNDYVKNFPMESE